MPLVPPLTATPSHFAPNSSTATEAANFALCLATRRQIISPAAIGLESGFFFLKVVSEAKRKLGAKK